MDAKLACPNCGEGVDGLYNHTDLACPQCGELLTLTSEHKLVLVHPIKTYLALDETTKVPATAGQLAPALFSVRIPLSDRRRKRSAELASERVNQQRKFELRGFVSGFMLSILGGLFLSFTLARVFLLENDWLGIAGIVIGGCFLFMGIAVAVWFYRLMQSTDKLQ